MKEKQKHLSGKKPRRKNLTVNLDFRKTVQAVCLSPTKNKSFKQANGIASIHTWELQRRPHCTFHIVYSMLQPTMLKSCLKRNEEAGTKKGPAPRRQHVKIDLTKTGTLEILHRSEMTNDDMAAVWLRAEEYAEFKTNFASVIRRMMKAPNERLEETDECTCRGLGTSSLWWN